MKKILPYFQYILPKTWLSKLAGKLAESRRPGLKNWLIREFIKLYPKINMHEANIVDPYAYETFNAFFTRKLKSDARVVTPHSREIASPADGIVAESGKIVDGQIIQAKNFFYSLDKLLGEDEEDTQTFAQGSFATIYLAPYHYHRVHLPIAGKLKKTRFIPGSLFSVNRFTSAIIPQLYSRNERYVSIYETPAGNMAVILVGALLVGSIQAVQQDQPFVSTTMLDSIYADGPVFQKGDEMGLFKMGSTVILLFEKDAIEWSKNFKLGEEIQYGQCIANALF